jgi:SPX domain protein involved in polyphosphate accumulation
MLMTKLIQRYLRSKEEMEKHRQVTLSDLESIKHEINELTKMTSEVQKMLNKEKQPERTRSLMPETANNVFLSDTSCV